MPKKPEKLFVVGFHRSGTSMLTRLLNLYGFDIGDCGKRANRWNQAGHWEHPEFVRINQGVMRMLRRRGRWCRPPILDNRPEWWLDPRFRWGDAVFHPRGMTARQLFRGCLWMRMRFNRVSEILRRGWEFKANSRSLFNAATFLAVNFVSKYDIMRKMGLRLGETDSIYQRGETKEDDTR